ncbi:sugar ABC transporter substrate-binding protein, partial [Pseudomonas syringae pv. tagetis]
VFCFLVLLYPLLRPVVAFREQQLVSLREGEAGPVIAFDALLPGWRADVFTAQNKKLGDYLRELGRYSPGLLLWEPELESLRVTGCFTIDNSDRELSLLAASVPLDVKM